MKFYGEESSLVTLCGGFPAGSVIGQDCFLVASNDSAQEVNTEDRFKYIDDLEILELVLLSGILQDYDVESHVPSDIPLDHKYLDASLANLNSIALWMRLNPTICSYMTFSRSKEYFVTHLTVNNNKIDQKHITKLFGCWVDEDAVKWNTNTKEICKSAYSRISMLSQLKYVRVGIEDLPEIEQSICLLNGIVLLPCNNPRI